MRIRRDNLDILFSQYIRMRANGKCERCGAYRGWQNLQCAHYHSRRKKSTRFDPDNGVCLDMGCHQYFHENHDEFKVFMIQKLGQQGLDMLDSRARTPVRYLDKQIIKLWLEKQIKAL